MGNRMGFPWEKICQHKEFIYMCIDKNYFALLSVIYNLQGYKIVPIGSDSQEQNDLPGLSSLLASLGHTGRRVVLGDTLNTLWHVIIKKSHNGLNKISVFHWALGRIHSHPGQMQPAGHQLDPPDDAEISSEAQFCASSARATTQHVWQGLLSAPSVSSSSTPPCDRTLPSSGKCTLPCSCPHKLSNDTLSFLLASDEFTVDLSFAQRDVRETLLYIWEF